MVTQIPPATWEIAWDQEFKTTLWYSKTTSLKEDQGEEREQEGRRKLEINKQQLILMASKSY